MTGGAEKAVKGTIVVHERRVLYTFETGLKTVTYVYVDGSYSGDIDGPAAETFVAVTHADGSQTHFGWGECRGTVLGRPGTLIWKFKGKPGSGDMELLSGTGEIADLKGDIRYEIDKGSTTHFTYEGVLRR